MFSGYIDGLLVILSINVIMAYAAALPLVAGQLNLGAAGFMAVGAYVAAYGSNELGLPIAVAILIGSLVSGVIALLIGIPVLRTSGIYLALATFALGQILVAVFLNLDVVGAAQGYPVFGFIEMPAIALTAIGIVLALFVLSQTRFWLYLTAIKNDPTVCDLFGVEVKNVQLAAFVLGGMLAAIAGGLQAHYLSYIEAQSFGALVSIYTVLFVILGGTQTVVGPLVGAAFFTFLPEVLRAGEEWRYLIFAAFIIGFMVLRPEGMITASMMRRLKAPLLRKGSAA